MKWRHLIPLLLVFLHPQGWAAEQASTSDMPRYALIIGNSHYQGNTLANPKADAELMKETLSDLKFKVTIALDLGRTGFFDSVRTFTETLPEGSVAVVYYAGHGMQIDGFNYLIPIDMTPSSERKVKTNAYPLNVMLERLQSARSVVNLVVLDACRNNPFLPSTALGQRGFSKLGLTRITAPRGTLIAYSTAPGQLAEDGKGRQNSLYTETLSKEMHKPDLPIEQILKNVSKTIRRATLDDQQPWFESSIIDDFYFLPSTGTKMIVSRPNVKAKAIDHKDARGELGDREWFMELDGKGWDHLHQDIEQRVQNMTIDELPGLRLRATKGNVIAQTTLGLAYRMGLVTATQDPHTTSRFGSTNPPTYRTGANNTQSLKWFRKAAGRDFPIAQVELAEMLYEGRGTHQDKATARSWLIKASHSDYKRAELDLLQIQIEQQSDSITSQQSTDLLNHLLPQNQAIHP